MYLPRTIKILGRTWKVKVLENVVDDDGNTVDGTCCKTKKTIEIDKKSTHMLETFIHEWMHAIWYESGIEDELPEKYSFVEHWITCPVGKEFEENKELFLKILKSCKFK